jgi:hypothetical protein
MDTVLRFPDHGRSTRTDTSSSRRGLGRVPEERFRPRAMRVRVDSAARASRAS